MPLDKKHRVSLVKRADEPAIGEDGYIHLEYRYNTYGDTTDVFNPYEEVVCYNLNTLPLDEADGIKMKVNSAIYGEQTLVFENMDQEVPNKGDNLLFVCADECVLHICLRFFCLYLQKVYFCKKEDGL